MRKSVLTAFVLAVLSVGVIASVAQADEKRLRASLNSYEEVPSVSSAAHGEFSADIDERDQVIRYSLTLSGTFNSSILFAHIHFGQRTANGGVVTFLCGGGTKPAPCSTTEPNTGEIRPADITSSTGAIGQGIAVGEWDEFVRALRAGVTYANVHSAAPAGQPGGEIRGQINDNNQRNDD